MAIVDQIINVNVILVGKVSTAPPIAYVMDTVPAKLVLEFVTSATVSLAITISNCALLTIGPLLRETQIST